MKDIKEPKRAEDGNNKKLTDAELLVLGLVAEMPRHGYQLEQVIEQRGMREWTQIGFSSIYFVLGKLEKAGLVTAKKPDGAKARKIYSPTGAGYQVLATESLAALEELRPAHSAVLLGMAHWPVMQKDAAIAALHKRQASLEAEMVRLEKIQYQQLPLPEFVEAIFDFSLSQLQAEVDWVRRTADYMECKPELE
jgi:DNA-binding PadR family transcriptional regulator